MSCVSVLTPGPFVSASERARGQHAGNVALILLAGVHVAAWLDRALHDGGGFLDLRALDARADEAFAGWRNHDRRIAGIAQADPRFASASFRVEPHGARHADDGEVAAAARQLHKAGA